MSFTVNHSLNLIRHKEKVALIGSARFSEEDIFELFSDSILGMKISARYGATYGMEFDAPKKLWPIFEIEFDNACNLHEYIIYVSNYTQFLSFCLGVKLKPNDIRLSRLSREETITALENRTYVGDHEAHYVWPEEEIESRDLWVGGSPVRAWDEEELTALRACLMTWMNRAPAWNNAYAMMMTSFALKNVISSERLVNACRWLEEIPISQSQSAISNSDINAISTSAVQQAEKLGYSSNIRERIEGAIKWIKAETAEERFTRLIATVREKFGKNILPEDVVMHLRRAIQFRGKSAHGHFSPQDDEEYKSFAKSILAMEAFCYLLTALELPINAEGVKRVKSNPVLRDYIHSF